MPHIETLTTSRQARVFLQGELGPNTQHVWLVLHGYRMLAQNFLRRFEELDEPGTVVAAPEGLSRFYVDGVRGKVGTSWMTKEARELEIEDQFHWLEQVKAYLDHQLADHQPKWHVIGFSQGVATAWRWLKKSPFTPDTFTIWAGSIPEEFSPEWDQRLGNLRLTLAYGNDDEFISIDRARAYVAALQQRYPHLELLPFEGKHDIPSEPLLKLKQRLA